MPIIGAEYEVQMDEGAVRHYTCRHVFLFVQGMYNKHSNLNFRNNRIETTNVRVNLLF
jgi:hypothetical protein